MHRPAPNEEGNVRHLAKELIFWKPVFIRRRHIRSHCTAVTHEAFKEVKVIRTQNTHDVLRVGIFAGFNCDSLRLKYFQRALVQNIRYLDNVPHIKDGRPLHNPAAKPSRPDMLEKRCCLPKE